MRTYKVYDKGTGLYVGTIEIRVDEVRDIERDFILRQDQDQP